jgi:hypothetical protein
MSRKGLRPHVWIIGSDVVDHKLYIDCQRAKAQAKYRNEVWEITEQEYIKLWRQDDLYKKKGRSIDHVCLTRIDFDLEWTVDNVEIISRHDHYKRSYQHKKAKMI